MSLTYQKNKEAIYRWRENNPDKYYECNKNYTKQWIENNIERHRANKRISQQRYDEKKRNWKSIRTIYFNILLEI
jgi:hypothetical protein